MIFFFMCEAARSFLHAWHSQSWSGSEISHAAKPTEVVGNASMMTYLRRKKMHEIPFSSSEGLGSCG